MPLSRILSHPAIVFVLLALAALQSFAQTQSAAVVMIDNRGFGGGSGSYLGEGFVLTCDHLFRNARGQSELGKIVVTFPSGEATAAELLIRDAVWDLALLKAQHPPHSAAVLPLASSAPRPGEAVFFSGYGGEGRLQTISGVALGYGYDKAARTGAADTLIVSGSARSGDSGGPLLNSQGEICGVLWGSGSGRVVGTQIGRVRQFADDWLEGSQSAAVGRVAPAARGGSCTGGRCDVPIAPSLPSGGSRSTDCTAELHQLRAEIAALKKQLVELSARQPLTGPRGPAGPMGPPGPSADAQVDLDALALAVKQKISGSIRVRVEPKR